MSSSFPQREILNGRKLKLNNFNLGSKSIKNIRECSRLSIALL